MKERGKPIKTIKIKNLYAGLYLCRKYDTKDGYYATIGKQKGGDDNFIYVVSVYKD